MNDPKLAFEHFLDAERLRDQKLVLMVSGGVDSMTLFHVAAQSMPLENIFVFHLHHNSRPESESDATFVAEHCEHLGVEYIVEKLDSIPTKNKENSWRKQRQKLSESYAQKVGADRIITAHHATDLVETMLYRITKGCGPAGLAPFDLSTKPFSHIPKAEIVQYAEKNSIEFREDSTNTDTHFARNRIRHDVLPSLREITPNLEQVFVKEMLLFRDLELFLKQHMQQLEGGKTSIELDRFLELSAFEQQHFLQHVSQDTASYDEIQDALRWLKGNPEGGTRKKVGNTYLTLQKNILDWESHA